MVWVSSCPQLLTSLLHHEKILKVIRVPHTPLLIVLTNTTITAYDQNTLLPIASHTRAEDSVAQHGTNKDIQTKQITVNTAQLLKIHTVNLFVQTEHNYLVIYLVLINHSKSLFEVNNNVNYELIQTGLPLSLTVEKNSFSRMIKSATKAIVLGNENHVDLENIENFNNVQLEDEEGNFTIPTVKLSVFKILKIGIGLQNYWLKHNSHNLIIFNNKNERQSSAIQAQEGNYFQIINMQSFRSEVFQLSDSDWYHLTDPESNISYINYNTEQNYFIFLNDNKELWYFTVEFNDSDLLVPVGHKIFTFEAIELLENFKISFNPQSNLILIHVNRRIELFKLFTDTSKLVYLKDIKSKGLEKSSIIWSPCGDYFVLLDDSTGYWSISTKFGSFTFSTTEIIKELDEVYEENRGFLRAAKILIGPNANSLFIVGHDYSKLYKVNLLAANDSADVFYDHEYLSIIQNNKSFVRFPIQPRVKKIISQIERFNGNTSKSTSKSMSGVLNISRNKYNQLAISYGDNISLSTPFSSGGTEFNNILWFNFRNYYLDAYNIVSQFWFNDYLVIVNRKTKDNFEDETENGKSAANESSAMVDELIVLDTTRFKYGNGGEELRLDNDLTLWKYDFKTTFIKIQPITISEHVCNVVILTHDLRLIILELNDNKALARKSSSADLKVRGIRRNYKIFIGVNKTIHLLSVQHKLAIKDVIQIGMVDRRHFFFLLKTGELFLLKNQTMPTPPSQSTPIGALKPNNMYDLIKIGDTIEFFKFQKLRFNDLLTEYIYVFNGEELLIYELEDLIENSFDMSTIIIDELEKEKHVFPIPISIETENFQPIILDGVVAPNSLSVKSLDLVGLENVIVNKLSSGGLVVKTKVARKLVLNNFIENELVKTSNDLEAAVTKYKQFLNYHYCLELLLFKYLTSDNNNILKRLITLIELNEHSEYIYINCLRKIEVIYWDKFFTILDTKPVTFMKRLIEINNVELCYNYLIIYLNYKREGEDEDSAADEEALNSNDKEIILKIMKMLDDSLKWDWCFELCRFIKLLQPSGELLKQIKETLQK